MNLSCVADCPSISLAVASLIVAAIVGVQLKNWLYAVPMTMALLGAAVIVGLLGQAAFDAQFDLRFDRLDQSWVQEQWLLFFLTMLTVMSASSGLISLFRSGQRLSALASFAAAALAFTVASALLMFEVFDRAPAFTIFAPSRPQSALLQAVQRKDFDTARALVSSEGNWTKDELTDALITAAEAGANSTFLRALLERGADPDAPRGNLAAPTALMAAANSGYPQNVGLLLDAKADVLARNYFGGTALHVVFSEHSYPPRPDPPGVDRPAVIELLVRAGTPVDIRDNWQRTPLIWNGAGRADVVAKLIALGADVNAQDSEGSTPLMTNNTAEAATLLLKAGANPFIRDPKGRTARENRDDAQYLTERAAIVGVIDRWIAANPKAARVAEAEAKRIGTSRVIPAKPEPEAPYPAEDISPIIEGMVPINSTIGFAFVMIGELALVTLFAWMASASARRMGFEPA